MASKPPVAQGAPLEAAQAAPAIRKGAKIYEPRVLECQQCGIWFDQDRPDHGKWRKFCSKECEIEKEFNPTMTERAAVVLRLGGTDVEVAKALGVSVRTIHRWKKTHPEFAARVRQEKDDFDTGRVEAALVHRATGYSHKAVKIFCDPKTGSTEQIEYTEHYPPDPTSAIFWLKNRNPERWKDRVDVEAGTRPGDPLANLMETIANAVTNRMHPTGAPKLVGND
jgi:hypothetical protein